MKTKFGMFEFILNKIEMAIFVFGTNPNLNCFFSYLLIRVFFTKIPLIFDFRNLC